MNNIPKEILKSERISLEPILKEHARLLYEELCNPNLYKYVSEIPPANLSELESKFADLEMGFGLYTGEIRLDWVIEEIQSGELIGMIQISIDENKVAKAGYVVIEKYWKNGFAYESLNAVLHFLFIDIRVDLVEASVSKGNMNSIKLLQNLGFSLIINSSAKKENSKELLFQLKNGYLS